MGYWTDVVPQWAWILIYWVLFLSLSNLGVLAYGEVEFWLSLYVIFSASAFVPRLILPLYQHQGCLHKHILHHSHRYQQWRYRAPGYWVQILG